jgi:hypothetical protein
MKVDLRYTEIGAKRLGEASGRVNVNNNSTITSLSQVEGKLSLQFLFTSSYEPNVGEIRIRGDILVSDSEKNIEKAVRAWEESGQKNLPVDMAEDVHNAIISNCVVETVILAREIQLPSPVPLPRISMKDREKQREETESYIR